MQNTPGHVADWVEDSIVMKMDSSRYLLAGLCLIQSVAIGALVFERQLTGSQDPGDSVCGDTRSMLRAMQVLEEQAPVWRGLSDFEKDTLLLENKETGRYFIVSGSLDGETCILDGGQSAKSAEKSIS